jgi:hypothetical protein
MKPAILLATIVLAACAVSRDGPMPADPEGDARLAEALAGRTAGGPRNCVRSQELRNSRGAGTNTILFDGPGDLVYVNRARGACPRIESWHAISHRSTTNAMCSGELIRVLDPNSGIEYGGCTLGEFVPWRRNR